VLSLTSEVVINWLWRQDEKERDGPSFLAVPRGYILSLGCMEATLDKRMFEWLLAYWAGYGDRAEQLFPALGDADHELLFNELCGALKQAQRIP
jgi:hypothetical protein